MSENENVESKKTSVDGPSLYDMNKQMIKQQGKMSNYAINEASKLIKSFFRSTRVFNQVKYFMLLCKEQSDYTVFRLNWSNNNVDSMAAVDVLDCLKNRGDVYSINYDNDKHTAVEIWIENSQDHQMYVYFLFPYDIGVIEEY